jgi:hypothetical protein
MEASTNHERNQSMSKTKLLTGALGIVAAYALAGVGQAHAFTSVNSPFGPNVTNVYVGMTGGVAKAVFRQSNGACSFFTLGNSSGLTDDFQINTNSANDFLIVVGGLGTRFDVCGTSVFPILYNGHFLDVNGSGGDDLVFNGTGDSFALGSDGNDTVETFSPIGRAVGQNGADRVFGTSAVTTDWLEGDADSDCLQDFGNSATTFDCGASTHDFFVFPNTPTAGCEVQVSGC